MPLVLEPDSHYDYVLGCDADKPKENQPTFVFRYLSSRKWREIASLSDSFDKNEAGAAAIDTVFEAIKKTLIGWRNMAGPDGKEIDFDVEKIEDLVTAAESLELLRAAVSQVPTAKDKKKFDSPSTSSTDRSARRAKDRKIAKTSQRS